MRDSVSIKPSLSPHTCSHKPDCILCTSRCISLTLLHATMLFTQAPNRRHIEHMPHTQHPPPRRPHFPSPHICSHT